MKDDTARAAEGVGPYAWCGADSLRKVVMVGAFADTIISCRGDLRSPAQDDLKW